MSKEISLLSVYFSYLNLLQVTPTPKKFEVSVRHTDRQTDSFHCSYYLLNGEKIAAISICCCVAFRESRSRLKTWINCFDHWKALSSTWKNVLMESLCLFWIHITFKARYQRVFLSGRPWLNYCVTATSINNNYCIFSAVNILVVRQSVVYSLSK